MKMSMNFFTEIEKTPLKILKNHTRNVILYKTQNKSVGDFMLTEISQAQNGKYHTGSLICESNTSLKAMEMNHNILLQFRPQCFQRPICLG